jgi:hypothetical protein
MPHGVPSVVYPMKHHIVSLSFSHCGSLPIGVR